MKRLLYIEDDREIGNWVKEELEQRGYAVTWLRSGEGAEREMQGCDLAILDIMLPGLDGFTIGQRLKKAAPTAPILLLSARTAVDDKLQGLQFADDYVTKPFHMEEILARIRALIRRAAGHASPELYCGPLRLDTRTSKADLDGVPLKLTSHEYRLLAYLLHHKGSVVSRTELVEHLYDQDFDRDSNTIEVFIGRLRKKLGVDLIETVRGMGYRMRDPDA